jgi:hypothetical protein
MSSRSARADDLVVLRETDEARRRRRVRVALAGTGTAGAVQA